jgi:hypothetical protein
MLLFHTNRDKPYQTRKKNDGDSNRVIGACQSRRLDYGLRDDMERKELN